MLEGANLNAGVNVTGVIQVNRLTGDGPDLNRRAVGLFEIASTVGNQLIPDGDVAIGSSIDVSGNLVAGHENGHGHTVAIGIGVIDGLALKGILNGDHAFTGSKSRGVNDELAVGVEFDKLTGLDSSGSDCFVMSGAAPQNDLSGLVGKSAHFYLSYWLKVTFS
jgi:hypothetical protein